jgi:intraflagellar transport protein 81
MSTQQNFAAGFNQGEMYEGQNPNQYKKKSMPLKNTVGTEDIREIVQRLNAKPFSENFTLVTFDELSTLDLLELLNKILAQLDTRQNVSIKDEPQDQTANRISDFLRVLNYPSNFDLSFQQGLVQGDKKTIYPILFYLLTKFPELQKRAYLAKFLLSLPIPEEYLADPEMKMTHQENKDLQAEFQVNHQQLEAYQKDAMAPNEIKKEINQLEQEKDQLVAKINVFKTKNTNKPEFQALLEATNLLRKEQEEEARLSEKLRTQRQQLEWTDQQLLSSQQRLIDSKKSLSMDNTPEQMLMGLRAEVKKNRDLCNERLRIEINDKKRKLDQIDQLLQEPPVSTSEISRLEGQLVQLRKIVQGLDEKLQRESNPSDDKLAIYKQQATLVAKKKEKIMEELKRTEEEKVSIEKDLQKKDGELQKLKGPGYKSKDEFKQYAANLRDKTAKFKKMKDELNEIKNEIGILARTEQIVKSRKDEYESNMRAMEQRKGILGYGETQANIEKISEGMQHTNAEKGKTLEEISVIVKQIEHNIQSKKSKLAPTMKDLKDTREKFKELDKVYRQKKADYEQVFAGVESENAALEEEVKKLRDETYKEDTKLQTTKYQTQVCELMIARLNAEGEYISGAKKLSPDYKSYREMLTNMNKTQDAEVKELKIQREAIKENYEPSQRQLGMLTDLKKLLDLKLQVSRTGGSGQESRGFENHRRNEEANGNVNRLVVRE